MGLGYADDVPCCRPCAGGHAFETTEGTLRRGAEFFDRLLDGRDMEPAARKLLDGTVTVDRDGTHFGDVLRFFEMQNAGARQI